MFRHILLPTDGSALSEAAIRNGVQFAQSVGAKVTGLYVMPEHHPSYYEVVVPEEATEQIARRLKELAESYLAAIQEAARKAGVACEVFYERDDSPYEVIIQTAEKKGCDLIMMASHGRRGVRALLLGSETQKVLTHSKVPVLVFR